MLLLCAWVLLFRAPLVSFVALATPSKLAFDLVLVAGLVILLRRRLPSLELEPTLRALPLAIAAFAALAHVLNAFTVQIELASGGLMVLGAWGLLGLWLPPRRWLQSIPLLIAGLCALPIGAALDLWIGFPLRIVTAQLTHALLEPVLGGGLATETIIVVDGGAGVQVDLPCSGVRSLYTGAIFWAAATWLERTRVGVLWLCASVVFALVLALTNLGRVLALVLLHVGAPKLASELLHVPLGVAAFVVACTLGWGLLRMLPRTVIAPETAAVRRRPAPLGWVTAGVLLLAAIPSPEVTAAEPEHLELEVEWAHPVAPDEHEARLFRARGADGFGKWDVELGRARGQLVVVRSRSWRSQHRPDVCHRGSGRRVVDERSVMIDGELPLRALRLSSRDGELWGLYWFQSADTITEDHGARVWSALDGDAEPWVMVSLVIDGRLALDDPDVAELLHRTRARAHALLQDKDPT